MKLISVQVENFRGIRKAEIEFGPGLNVLYGPNDLGKSSLATAIRAALLMQASSREHEEFISWSGAGDPHVKLVFESEPQRIWRVRKTFGSAGQSFLDESRNGVEFTNVKRGREVDGQLSEILRWGLAPPGLKGRPKGMPMTFLSTALLAEQDQVAAIFERALSQDSDDSGKKRLIEALQAAAEDPLYKRVLDRVQAHVDLAFTSTGKPKRGQDSPWVRNREAIQRKEEDLRQCNELLQKTESIEADIRALRTREFDQKDRVAKAEGILEQLEAAWRHGQQRAEIAGRLQTRKDALAEVTAILQRLEEAEKHLSKCHKEVEAFAKRERTAREGLDDATRQAQLARDEVARVQSEDRARERLLQRESVEKHCAELRTRQVETGASLALAERVRRSAVRVSELEAEGAKLAAGVNASKAQHDRAVQALAEIQKDAREMETMGQWMRSVDARKKVNEAAAGLAQLEAWRAAAREKRAAAAFDNAESHIDLTPAQLQALQKLDQELQVARARLEVGLEVSIRAKGKLRALVSGDDGALVSHDLDGSLLETAARREIAIDLENVAEIIVSGGSAEARRTALGLQARWAAEVEPVLKRTGVVNVTALARKIEESAVRMRQVKEALDEAAQLEQRAADQPDWASLRQTAAEGVVAGLDEPTLEKLARSMRIANSAEVDKRLDALRMEATKRLADERRLSEDRARAAAALQANQTAAVLARGELAEAQPSIEGDWETALRKCRSDGESIERELKQAQAQLASIASDDDHVSTEAQTQFVRAEAKRAAAESAHENAKEELRKAENLRAGIEGQLALRREAAARCDEAGGRAAVAQVEAELALVPPAPRAIAAGDLEAGRRQVEETRLELERIEDEIHAKRGALQHVGGDVARQHAADAQEALQAERQREQEIQNEYAAWDLLRNTLLEAEKEEGVHLGRALGGPVSKRFSELTHGRYGETILGANLDTPGISAQGAARNLRALSVGTRDQLSTIFRLSLAEQLQSAVMLDDQLTQTDIHRMAWLRDLIREVTGRIQVIVFTCRASDYLLPEEMQGIARGAAVQAIDLAQAIDRGAAPRVAAAGG